MLADDGNISACDVSVALVICGPRYFSQMIDHAPRGLLVRFGAWERLDWSLKDQDGLVEGQRWLRAAAEDTPRRLFHVLSQGFLFFKNDTK